MEKDILPFQEEYPLNEEQKAMVARYIEELTGRLKTTVTIEVYKENHMVYPKLDHRIFFKVTCGNWKHIGQLSVLELDSNNYGGMAFFYFLRRLCDEVMEEILTRGANYF